jgi:DNA polymerase-3 subunit alpha
MGFQPCCFIGKGRIGHGMGLGEGIFGKLHHQIIYFVGCKDILYEDNIVMIEGTIDASEEESPKLLVNKVTELKKEPVRVRVQNKLYIKVRDLENYKNIKKDLFYCICRHKGQDPVIIYNEKDRTNMVLPDKYRVNIEDEILIKDLKELLGQENIAVRNRC